MGEDGASARKTRRIFGIRNGWSDLSDEERAEPAIGAAVRSTVWREQHRAAAPCVSIHRV
jgi:hypothetical protein